MKTYFSLFKLLQISSINFLLMDICDNLNKITLDLSKLVEFTIHQNALNFFYLIEFLFTYWEDLVLDSFFFNEEQAIMKLIYQN